MIEYSNSKYNGKHPYKNTPEYKAWLNMNRIYPLQVCDDWKWRKHCETENKRNYQRFLNFLGHRPEGFVLIRLDKSSPFGPGNTAWGTHEMNNKFRGPYKKYSYSRDEELIKELERRGYTITPLA